MRAVRAAGAALVLFATACAPFGDIGRDSPKTPDDLLVFKRSSYADLKDWGSSDPRLAYQAFQRSCGKLSARADSDGFGGAAGYGTVSDWRPACQAALQLTQETPEGTRRFFETWFVPAQALNRDEAVGLFTGYYEPELNGSRVQNSKFSVPLLLRPKDLVQVDLGAFRPALKGERVAGRVVDGKLVPYATRAQIVAGGYSAEPKPLAYVDDGIAAFFLQIQGSGRIRLTNGETIRAAFDGQNGHPYVAIGRVLIERGEIQRGQVSMQSIRAWLVAHPAKAQALMNENPSFVFFKELPIADATMGADGAQGVALTSEASLAVDLKFHGLGAPIWIDATSPAANESVKDEVLRRLVVAQDTGGAIRGPVRGDVYWGVGAKAESIAGRMAHKGSMFVLLPKSVAQRLN